MVSTALVDRLALLAPQLSTKISIPAFVYGTAWKKDKTTDLVYQALCNGFTAIDTACQPKHYREDLVGAGLRKAIKDSKISRADVYVQTKFTSIDGQDPSNVPYDPKESLTEQVRTSIGVSLNHFDVTDELSYLDSVVLHSPMRNLEDTLEVWRTLETFVPYKIRTLGISNCPLFMLMDLYERATVKPSVIQNRFYPATKYDISVRRFCEEKSMIYQSFWTLSANPQLMKSSAVLGLAEQLEINPASALYCLVLGLGNTVILNGTTNVKHMREDWESLAKVSQFSQTHLENWNSYLNNFKVSIGQRTT